MAKLKTDEQWRSDGRQQTNACNRVNRARPARLEIRQRREPMDAAPTIIVVPKIPARGVGRGTMENSVIEFLDANVIQFE